MTDPVKEQLSACLDGELPEGELDLLLKQVGRDSQLRASLGRYSLIGETLRAKASVAAPLNFSERVAAAIAAEPAISVPAVARRAPSIAARWMRPAAGVAVAAGVAAIAVFALQAPQQATGPSTIAGVTPEPIVSASDPASYIVPASTASSGYVPAARLTNYVVAHSEYSSPLGRRSVLSGVLAEEDPGDDSDVETGPDVEPATEVTQP
jgi:negative regulator of sigma E activity